ncbi:hypothetical protein OIO90_000768 [Microbotryomycetes sp. JL221]|nr:hypothetical protein OIO90_000768 [Microbotryomycetes sp. JL221]
MALGRLVSGHPHLLLLQVANAFFKLPGDYIDTNEDEQAGLHARLQTRLGPSDVEIVVGQEAQGSRARLGTSDEGHSTPDWHVNSLLSQWWRPNFEGFMYPYMPVHVTTPKEVKSIFLVDLPEHAIFHVPKNMKLVALPLFELYDNAIRYGPTLAAVPHLLSKYTMTMT